MLIGVRLQSLTVQEKANHPVKSVEKTIGIIEGLKNLRSATLGEIADEIGMNKSVIHNHLSTLREHEYVVKKGEEYQLSFQFLNVGGVLRNETELYTAAKPQADQLANETGELVTLATQELGRGVVLYRSKGGQAVDIDTYVGSRVSLHNSALGKAILAHLPKDDVDEIVEIRGLQAHTLNTITDKETLYAEFEQIEEKGYAFDDEEQWRGLQCVAAPILTDEGVVKGAISVSAPKSRIESEDIKQKYIKEMKHAANVIELNISYS